MKKHYALFLLVLFLSACAQLGLVRPESVPDRIAYGYATVEQVAEATTSLLRQKHISKETAQRVQQSLSAAIEALHSARDLHYLGNSKVAGERLEAGLKAIANAQKRLKGEKDV